jgi:hypothetical protein
MTGQSQWWPQHQHQTPMMGPMPSTGPTPTPNTNNGANANGDDNDDGANTNDTNDCQCQHWTHIQPCEPLLAGRIVRCVFCFFFVLLSHFFFIQHIYN